MRWQWFHRWGSPKYVYEQANKWSLLLGLCALILFIYSVISGLFLVPMDYQQKDAFRIIYVHVPCAFLSLSIYAFIGGLSIIYLVWRIKITDMLAKISAPYGATFTALALLTGAIWGKPMWGTWWIWDARLTSELILLFLYFGYMGLRSAIKNPKTAAVGAAILAVVGLLDLPIIHYSVEWWQTLHQGATLAKFAKPSISAEMLYPLLSMIAALYLFFAWFVLLSVRGEILWRERYSTWVQKFIHTGA